MECACVCVCTTTVKGLGLLMGAGLKTMLFVRSFCFFFCAIPLRASLRVSSSCARDFVSGFVCVRFVLSCCCCCQVVWGKAETVCHAQGIHANAPHSERRQYAQNSCTRQGSDIVLDLGRGHTPDPLHDAICTRSCGTCCTPATMTFMICGTSTAAICSTTRLRDVLHGLWHGPHAVSVGTSCRPLGPILCVCPGISSPPCWLQFFAACSSYSLGCRVQGRDQFCNKACILVIALS